MFPTLLMHLQKNTIIKDEKNHSDRSRNFYLVTSGNLKSIGINNKWILCRCRQPGMVAN